MPYFVFTVYPNKTLDYLETFSKYREARDYVREQRDKLTENDEFTVRLVHAKHKEEAERLLKSTREARPAGAE